MAWKPKIVNGEIRMKGTPNNIKKLETYLQNLVKDSGVTTSHGKPGKPKDFPKVFLDGKQREFRNKAGTGYTGVDKFRLDSLSERAASATKRSVNEAFPGQKVTPRTKPDVAAARTGITDHIREWAGELGYEESQIEKYEFELAEELRSQGKKVNKANIDSGGTFWTTGHDNPLDAGGINTPRGTKLQSASANAADSSKFKPNLATQTAIGNPAGTGNKYKNWQRDFLVWADRPENGGDGILPQRRRTYSPKVEAEFDALNRQGLSPTELTEAVDEKIGRHLLRDAVNSKLAKNLSNVASKTRRADLVAQTGTGIATGNVVQAGAAGTTLAATEVLKNPQVQKRVAKQVSELVAKRGAKSAAKLVPGVDILISGAETWDYLRQGKLDQAGIAAVSGLIGWIPVVGDGAAAALDFTNTGIDISRLNLNQSPDIDMSEGGKVSKYESGILHSPTGQGDEAFDNVVNALKENPNAFDRSGFGNRTSVKKLTRTLSKLK